MNDPIKYQKRIESGEEIHDEIKEHFHNDVLPTLDDESKTHIRHFMSGITAGFNLTTTDYLNALHTLNAKCIIGYKVSQWTVYAEQYDSHTEHKYYLPVPTYTNLNSIESLIKWWCKTYKIRENTQFVDAFKTLEYCFTYYDDKDFRSKFWPLISGIVITIYEGDKNRFDYNGIYAINFEPLTYQEWVFIFDKIGIDNIRQLLPICEWSRLAGRQQRCMGLTYRGLRNSGLPYLFERRTKKRKRGKRRVKLHHLLYTMIIGSIPDKHTLTTKCIGGAGVCINPKCYSTVPIVTGKKRPRGKGITPEQRVSRMFEEFPDTKEWAKDNLKTLFDDNT